MKKTISVHTMCLLACFLFAFSCTNSNNEHKEDPKDQAQDINKEKFDDRDMEKDADRLIEAYLSNLYEIKASENASARAQTADVKKLAAMMVTAHTKMSSDIQALAARKNVTLPTDISDDHRKKLDDLAQKDGLDYDKEYADQMKNKHEDGIRLFERTADKSEDAEIKQFASTSLPDLRMHLDMITATKEKLNDMKDTKTKTKEKNTWDDKSHLHNGKDDIHEKKN